MLFMCLFTRTVCISHAHVQIVCSLQMHLLGGTWYYVSYTAE